MKNELSGNLVFVIGLCCEPTSAKLTRVKPLYNLNDNIQGVHWFNTKNPVLSQNNTFIQLITVDSQPMSSEQQHSHKNKYFTRCDECENFKIARNGTFFSSFRCGCRYQIWAQTSIALPDTVAVWMRFFFECCNQHAIETKSDSAYADKAIFSPLWKKSHADNAEDGSWIRMFRIQAVEWIKWTYCCRLWNGCKLNNRLYAKCRLIKLVLLPCCLHILCAWYK